MSTNQFLVLDKISMEYHAFRKDQLLTHTQLNELIDYFEDQDRLTRTCLIGVGLVCGLVVDYDAKEPAVSVGKGCGVTTDGDLLVMNPTTFRDYKLYDNRKKGTNDPIYDPFFPATDGGKQINLWELVIPDSQGALPLDSKPLGTFNADTGKVLDDMTVLLYLEYYLQDPDKCTAIDCDNQGPRQVSQIKVLLLSKVDMEKVINRDPAQEVIADSIYLKYHGSGVQYFNLPLIKAKRVILNTFNNSSIALLAKSYTGIVQVDGGKLIKAVKDLYAGFQFMIDPAGKTNINNLLQDLQLTLGMHPKIYHAQYLYDYYKDLITAYNELRVLLFSSMSECCPDKYAFPKHIMLGELKPFGIVPAPYRHEFYPSPAVTGARDKIANCRSMWLRLQQLIQQFNLPDQPSTVKITPSTDYDRLLEERAVPFYYKDVKSIVQNWNYAYSRRGTEKNILSYHAPQYAAGLDSTINPLDYSIDANNFFRIEGHLGKQLGSAMELISGIKNNKSVPFDLVAVRINKTGNLSDINPDDFDCQFEDLNAILKAWLIEQNCLFANIARFFTGFSTNKAIGFHTRIDDYKAVDQPVYAATGKPVDYITVSGISILAESPALNTGISIAATPICKTVYTLDKTVVGNLETNPGSLGIQFAETMKQPALSADDIIADVKRRTASDPNLLNLSNFEREIVYEAPITVVSHVSEISLLKPYRIDEINTALLNKYLQLMERLCAYAKKLRSRMEGIFTSDNYSRNGFETYYLFLIEELIANCCAAEKLESLLEEINKRKQKILDSLLFANYASQHPGLEHKAGVHRGGTFVLLYAQQVRTARTIELTGNALPAGQLLLVTDENRGSKNLVYSNIDNFAYYLVTNQGKVNFDEEVATYLKLHQIKDGSLEEQLFNRRLSAKIKEICGRLTKEEEATVAANVVIADFTLPYLCCSDCPPMVFIMPKQAFNLSLPKAAACSNEALLQFRKEPEDGIVKTTPGLDNVIVNTGNNTFFDPTKVPEAFIGKEIGFTINDQVTDCRITVFKHPVAAFEFIIESENDDAIIVIFNNFSDDATGSAYVYEWDFGDGRPALKVDNKEPVTIIYKKATLIKLKLEGNIPVKLTAANGPCTDTFLLNVPFKIATPVSLTLPNEVVCNDSDPLKFNVQPVDGLVASPEEPAAVKKINNEFVFDPGLVKNFNKQISFSVNGKQTNCRITVLLHPAPAFDFNAVSTPGTVVLMLVTFTNLSDPQNNQQLNYNWKFSDGTSKNTTDTKPFQQQFNITSLRNQGQTELTVTLLASNSGCEESIERKVPFPLVDIPATCTDTVKAAITSDAESLQTTAIKNFLTSIQTDPQFTLISNRLTASQKIIKLASNQVDNFNQTAVQVNLLSLIKRQLDQLYADKVSKAANEIVIMPQISALLRLALNILKCQTEISGNVKEILFGGILNVFKNIANDLAQMLPAFNKDNQFLKFLDKYLNTTNQSDQQFKDEIKKFGETIKSTFQA